MMSKLQREISKITRSIVRGYRPARVILYGSAASGKFTPDSDVDLLVVKDTKKNAWDRLKEVDRYIEHTVPVDVLVYTPREIKKRLSLGDFFIEDILKSGKVIYAK
jgi:predicted nucleotidyltransferase